MRRAATVADTLFTKTQQRVLGLLYGHPDSRFYTSQIVRMAAMGRGTVCRELSRLAAAGIITPMRQGNQVWFQANRDAPIYRELLAITRKTFGLADAIRTALAPMDSDIRLAFVYGSMAGRDGTKSSDIDLMIVADAPSYSYMMDALLPLEESLGRTIHPSLYGTSEMRSKLQGGNSFLERVLHGPKIWIKGGDNDLKALR